MFFFKYYTLNGVLRFKGNNHDNMYAISFNTELDELRPFSYSPLRGAF